MIYLKDPLNNSEVLLHNARLKLRDLEQAQKSGAPVVVPKRALYQAMSALQGEESDYFARRYFGRDQQGVLHGWNTEGKQQHFRKKISELVGNAQQRVADTNTIPLHQHAINAAADSDTACSALQAMDNKWYNNGSRTTAPPNFGN
ncbi:unnamed protein product, partial [Ectocarpus sp. 12 AP-2014]